MKVFLVLETEKTSTRMTISELSSIISQYLILQLKSSTTINFAWQKSGGGFAGHEISNCLIYFSPGNTTKHLSCDNFVYSYGEPSIFCQPLRFVIPPTILDTNRPLL